MTHIITVTILASHKLNFKLKAKRIFRLDHIFGKFPYRVCFREAKQSVMRAPRHFKEL